MGDVRVSDQVAEVAQTAVVRPGDTLVIRVDPRSVSAEVDRMLSKMKQALPGVEVFVVGAEEMAIYRPEARYEYSVGANVTAEQAARFADELARRQATSSPRRTA